MPKRLPELLRQRALLQEHLAWLDREIATEHVDQPPPLPVSAPTVMKPVAPAPPPSEPPADAEKILARYQQDPGALATDTRRAVLKIFGYAALVSLLLAILAYWLCARHLGRWW